MVSAVHGSLLECDIPTKVFILHLNDEQLPSERFVIQDLDETHLLVQPHKMEMLRREVKTFQERSQYVPTN
jgi:TFIIH basal transcription factor complex TTD-A subunit